MNDIINYTFSLEQQKILILNGVLLDWDINTILLGTGMPTIQEFKHMLEIDSDFAYMYREAVEKNNINKKTELLDRIARNNPAKLFALDNNNVVVNKRKLTIKSVGKDKKGEVKTIEEVNITKLDK